MNLEDLIRYSAESDHLDFKREQYNLGGHVQKNEILKDLSAFANHPSDEDKYIIIGVTERNGLATEFHDIGDLIDEAKYQQFVHSNIEPLINFEYMQFFFDGKKLACFRIFNNVHRPYLFKKNILINGKSEFRMGDGYIRLGSSTRKMVREDLERIYEKRYRHQDRRDDIIVTPMIKHCVGHDLSQYMLDCLEVTIENRSMQSINLDVDLKVLTNNGVEVFTTHTLKDLLNKEARQRRSREQETSILRYQNIPGMSISDIGERDPFPFNMPLMDISFTNHVGYCLASLTRRLGEIAALSIPQVDKVELIFQHTLILHGEHSTEINGEITVRSDVFSKGALILPFRLPYDPKK